MKNIILRILIILCFPISIMTINFSIDYRGFFNKSQFVDSVINNQLKKVDQVIYVNIPERKILKNKIEKLKNESLDTVVIGSSRTLMLGKNIKLKLNNFSVSSANLYDYIEIFKLLRANNISVKNFIIEFHENLFTKTQNERHKIFKGLNTIDKIKFLFDFNYLNENLSKKIEILDDSNLNNYKLFYDGSIDYNANYYSESFNQTLKNNNLIKEEIEIKKLIFDYKKVIEFNSIISQLNNNIYLYVSPKHPIIYKKNILNDQLMEILNLVKKHNPSISIIGSLNPFEFELEDIDFFDAMHIKPQGLKKIFDN